MKFGPKTFPLKKKKRKKEECFTVVYFWSYLVQLDPCRRIFFFKNLAWSLYAPNQKWFDGRLLRKSVDNESSKGRIN